MTRPTYHPEVMAKALALASRAERLHRKADAEQGQMRAAIRKTACDLERQADDLVPVEYRR